MTERERLVAKYTHLLALHNRYRLSVATAIRLPSLSRALVVVGKRIDAIDARTPLRLAA